MTYFNRWCALSALLLVGSLAQGSVLYESAIIGATNLTYDDHAGTPGGVNLSEHLYLGVRFYLATRSHVQSVGGNMVGDAQSTGQAYAAVVSLTDGGDFPDTNDLNGVDVLGVTHLEMPRYSREVVEKLELTLDPGWYALVLGSGLNGATGFGAMPGNNYEVGEPSYIAGGLVFNSEWQNLSYPQFNSLRFVVYGNAIPEPAGVLTTSSLICLLMACRGEQIAIRAK